MDRLRDRAKVHVKDIFHAYRRTFARDAWLTGIPEAYILAIMGWDDRQMLIHYTGAMLDEEDNAVDAFNDFKPFVDPKKNKNPLS